MKKHIIFSGVVLCGILLSLDARVVSMQNNNQTPPPGAHFSTFKTTEDIAQLKLLEKQLELYDALMKKATGKKDEPKKGYVVILSQEAKKITETMIKVAIWTATLPVVFVVCVTTTGAVLEILARLNVFHGAGEVLWGGASGAFADIMDGVTRGWFSSVLGLNKQHDARPVVFIGNHGQLALPAGLEVNKAPAFSWFSVKNPENATPYTPYLG